MEKEKTLKDYINFNDTEQMFFALYPLIRRGELDCVDVANLLGHNLNSWDVLKMFGKNNLSTLVGKETTIGEELENSKKCEIDYNE